MFQRLTHSLYLIPASLLIGGSLVALSVAHAQSEASTSQPVMCTADAFECPDGSFVGRTTPDCEFICPSSSSTTKGEVASSSDQTPVPTSVKPREDVRPERQMALSTARQERIINLSANVSNRMDAVVSRLFNIIDRFETRITTMNQAGSDTTAAATSLRTAAATLGEARVLLGEIDSIVISATTSEAPYSAWQTVNERYDTIAERIKTSHATLKQTLALLKVAPAADVATTTLPLANTASTTLTE